MAFKFVEISYFWLIRESSMML